MNIHTSSEVHKHSSFSSLGLLAGVSASHLKGGCGFDACLMDASCSSCLQFEGGGVTQDNDPLLYNCASDTPRMRSYLEAIL